MSKRLAIEILQKASNPSTPSFADIEPDDDVSIIITVYYFVNSSIKMCPIPQVEVEITSFLYAIYY